VGIAGPDAYGQRRKTWRPGDVLFLFTDGLADTLSSDVTGSGEEYLLRNVEENRQASPARIVEVLFGLTIPATPKIPADDRTAIILRA
jgi:serine phosphatase RsbU (regulator of sigma subunit)